MGPQYFHIQAYSRKKNRAHNCISQVLAEASRDPLYSMHVKEPQLPRLVTGVGIDQLRIEHDEMIVRNAIYVAVKNRSVNRAIRIDRKSLLTAVASFPIPTADIDKNHTEETRRLYNKWVDLNVEFLRNSFGRSLKSVIEHTDEEYPHLHAYILPDEIVGCFALHLHPGEIARAKAAYLAKKSGVPTREITKAANVAYRSAMRDLQDIYYHSVGAPSGLTRYGPKRTRKTRKEWRADKAAGQANARTLEKVDAIRAREAAITASETLVKAEEDKLKLEQATLDQRANELSLKEANLQEKVRALDDEDGIFCDRVMEAARDLDQRWNELDEREVEHEKREVALQEKEIELVERKIKLDKRSDNFFRYARVLSDTVYATFECLDLEKPANVTQGIKSLRSYLSSVMSPPEDPEPEDDNPSM